MLPIRAQRAGAEGVEVAGEIQAAEQGSHHNHAFNGSRFEISDAGIMGRKTAK